MKTKLLGKLAGDSQFIPGVYNYCDRWCERCSLSNHCLTYAMEKAEDDGDPAARDLSNQKFWDKVHEHLQGTVELLREEAKAHGIDLDDPELRASMEAQERAERRLAAKNRLLTNAAMAYAKAAGQWFETADPLFRAKGVELETLARIEVGDPMGTVTELSGFVEVIRWYQHFIYVKLRRAIEGRASEELEPDEALKVYPRDSDGSAKIALIAIDRSIAAWSGLRLALGDDADGILDLLTQLASIRRESERLFPRARAFVRPGFDAPNQEHTQRVKQGTRA